MNVLLVHNFYRTFHVGGEDVVFKRQKRALEHRLPGSLHVYTISNDDVTRIQAAKYLFDDAQAKKIGQLILEHKIDVMHVHNDFPLLTPQIFKVAKDSGVKVTCQTIHNYRRWCMAGTFFRAGQPCELCTTQQSFWPGVRYRCYQNKHSASLIAGAAMKWYENQGYYESVDRFFFLSKTQEKKLLDLGVPKNKLRYMPNSLSETHHIADVPKAGFVFVGRLEQSKGIFHLLNIWMTLPHQYELTVVGTSPDFEAIKAKYASKHIRFLGRCPETATLQIMSGSKFLIQPSLLEETFGLTIIEAMSCGTPVIGLPIGTRNELIAHGQTGYITELEQLPETIKVCDALTQDAYQKLSEAARTFANTFSEDMLTERCIEYYKEALVTVVSEEYDHVR